MRDPKRIDEICRRLAAAWKTCPDLRLGQIIENVKLANKIDEKGDLFYIEDYQMIGMIEDHMYGHIKQSENSCHLTCDDFNRLLRLQDLRNRRR